MPTGNQRSTPDSNTPAAANIGTGSKVNKALRNIQFLVAVVVLGLAFPVWSMHETTTAIGFVLCAASLLLTSFGALHRSDKPQKGVIVISISLFVAAAGAFGAYTFLTGIEQESLGGPRVLDVQPVSSQPCTAQSQASPLS